MTQRHRRIVLLLSALAVILIAYGIFALRWGLAVLGTGMLLFALAPGCRHYVGTDFSPAALAYVRGQLPAAGLSHVVLLERPADDFSGKPRPAGRIDRGAIQVTQ